MSFKIVPDSHRTLLNSTMTATAILTGIAAAVFWFWSARVPIPEVAFTWNADFRPLTSALAWQSKLSAWAAILTGVSIICQACAQ